MSIRKLVAKNFKGISDHLEFDLAPLTIFLGQNSSGKSSCLHALAALAQTVKLGDGSRALVLDDEYAQVHLGRFIEIVHTKSYKDPMELGVWVGDHILRKPVVNKDGKATNEKLAEGSVSASYTFKSTIKTQEISVSRAVIVWGDKELIVEKNGEFYTISNNQNNEKYQATLTGNFFFQLEWMSNPNDGFFDAYLMLRNAQDLIAKELRSTLYLGPFRISPNRRYAYRGAAPNEVGAQGESAVSLLVSEHLRSKKRDHALQICSWLDTLGLAKGVSVSRVGKSDLFDVDITLQDGVELPIADLGYGISQILPVLVQCSFASKGSTLLFEQPELHLHPAAGAKLMHVFSDVIKKKVTILAETHSPDLIKEIFNMLRDKKISLNDVIVYDVCRTGGKSVYNKLEIYEEDGAFEIDHPWGKGLA